MILDLVEDIFFAPSSFQVHVASGGLFEWEWSVDAYLEFALLQPPKDFVGTWDKFGAVGGVVQ